MKKVGLILCAALQEYKIPFSIALFHSAFFDAICYYVYFGNKNDLVFYLTLLSAVSALPFVYILTLSRRIALIVLPLIFVIDSIAAYFVAIYKIDIKAGTLALVFESDFNEAKVFVDYPLLILIVVVLIGTIWVLGKTLRTEKKDYVVIATALLLTVPIYEAATIIRGKLNARGPTQLPNNLYLQSRVYFKERKKLISLAEHKIDLAKIAPASANFDDLTAILIIGEAARADHFNLYGYSRPTTPLLNEKNVIAYKAQACANKTRISVPCLMTRSTLESHDDLNKESSFVSIFRAVRFDTIWFSNQRVMHRNDTITTSIANEANTVSFYRDSYKRARDELLLPLIEKQINLANPNKLIIIHTIGSHWAYTDRYDRAHEKFLPTCRQTSPWMCNKEELINSYDNTILYTDAFIADVISLVETKNAFVIYTSDHGESLGENGLYSHGQMKEVLEQQQVPLMIWASKTYKETHAEQYKAALLQKNKYLSHDYIFHSMLDCAGIHSILIDKNLSLCSNNSGE